MLNDQDIPLQDDIIDYDITLTIDDPNVPDIYDVIVDKDKNLKKNKIYFPREVEQHIAEYLACSDATVKNQIYESKMKYAFDKLAENIINTFKPVYIQEDFKDIQTRLVSHMLLNLYKYDSTKGKAFSYFSVMAKNFVIIWNREHHDRLKSTLFLSKLGSDNTINPLTNSMIKNNSSDDIDIDIKDSSLESEQMDADMQEFVAMMVAFWDKNIISIFVKERDREIAHAITELFRSVHTIEYFNKKSLFILIREMTGHRTLCISKVINCMLTYYTVMRRQYLDVGELDEQELISLIPVIPTDVDIDDALEEDALYCEFDNEDEY